jgi:hypothetical protein
MNADLKRLIRLQTIDLDIQQLRAKIDTPAISKSSTTSPCNAQLAAAQEKTRIAATARNSKEVGTRKQDIQMPRKRCR